MDVTVGDPLGVGSRQETKASLCSPPPPAYIARIEDADRDEADRLEEFQRGLRNTRPSAPSTALYRIQSAERVCVNAETDFFGKQLVAACEDNAVRLWEVLPADQPVTLDIESSKVRLGCDSVYNSEDVTSRTVEQGRCRVLRGHTGTVYSTIFLAGDRHIVSTSEDTTVRIWDKVSGAGLAVLHGHLYPVWCAASDSLGVNFVTGGMDRTARLWRPDLAYPLRVYVGHEQDVDCVR